MYYAVNSFNMPIGSILIVLQNESDGFEHYLYKLSSK